MREPFEQFANRIIRNGEVKEFIEGLLMKGAGRTIKQTVQRWEEESIQRWEEESKRNERLDR